MLTFGILGLILGFIVSKEGKIPNPMKVHAIVYAGTYQSITYLGF
jgi:hypothetical protein